jgi:hypothetical protein
LQKIANLDNLIEYPYDILFSFYELNGKGWHKNEVDGGADFSSKHRNLN